MRWDDWFRGAGYRSPLRTCMGHNVHMLRYAPSGGFKTAPVALTLGYGGASTTGTGTTVVVQHMPKAARRTQLHLANRNPRYAMADSPAVAISAIAIGLHDGAGGSDAWSTFPTAGETPYASGWVSVPQAWRGKDIAVRYTWSSSGTVRRNIGTAWTGGARNDTPPLFAWLELEVPCGTPVVAVFGDSLSSGASSSRPVVDSWIAQWAKANDAVPAHWSHSGDKASGWPATADRKWGLYGRGIAAPDAMVYCMGSNDLAESGITPWEMQRRILSTVGVIRSRITSTVYGATILPRTHEAPGSTFETVRRQINTWLPQSGLFHDVFEFSAAASPDDKRIRAAYDADGIHLNSAGYAALAAAVGHPRWDLVDVIGPGPLAYTHAPQTALGAGESPIVHAPRL